MASDRYTTRASITLTLSKEVKEYLESYSKKTDIPISRYIDRLVREQMERDKQKASE